MHLPWKRNICSFFVSHGGSSGFGNIYRVLRVTCRSVTVWVVHLQLVCHCYLPGKVACQIEKDLLCCMCVGMLWQTTNSPTCTLFKLPQNKSLIHSCFPRNNRLTTLSTQIMVLYFKQKMGIVSTHFVCLLVGSVANGGLYSSSHPSQYEPGLFSQVRCFLVIWAGYWSSTAGIWNIFLCTAFSPWKLYSISFLLGLYICCVWGTIPQEGIWSKCSTFEIRCVSSALVQTVERCKSHEAPNFLILKSIGGIQLGSPPVWFNTPLGETDLSFLLS